MELKFVDFVEGAQSARGVAVVIDVFRAFTTACYCVQAGAKEIIAVGDSERALDYRHQLPNIVLLGERFGKCLPGFDFGNSPSVIEKENLEGKTIIHTTHAGTQGLVNAVEAAQVLTGAFVNARATADYIVSRRPEQVTLVRMGLNANTPSDEDWLYADYLAALLRGESVSDDAVEAELRRSPFAARFFDSAQPWSPEADFDCCLNFNKFNFVLQADRINDDACKLSVLPHME
ncbi:2-phosphosulfolactate phosphatase [Teredinibacter purpureus]|uniref:2-phosphosulfolactate phosphatase n=1 Tax=Teredinibacter purpureus TaxID=2731756 RepID=UPI0005F7F5DC|nr:2-phosphosulfolactate phosphatase [Teredinibacter purpureus]